SPPRAVAIRYAIEAIALDGRSALEVRNRVNYTSTGRPWEAEPNEEVTASAVTWVRSPGEEPAMTGSQSSFMGFPRSDLEQPTGARFERQAARHPNRIAVKGTRRSFTYAQLGATADGLVRAILARRGPGPEPVALLLEHDALVLAAILAVLKVGKIYVGLDA